MLLPRLPSGPELTAPVAAGCSLSLQAAMDVTALLNALSSPDASLRQPAEQQVEAAKQSNMVRGAATSPSSHPRRLAGLSCVASRLIHSTAADAALLVTSATQRTSCLATAPWPPTSRSTSHSCSSAPLVPTLPDRPFRSLLLLQLRRCSPPRRPAARCRAVSTPSESSRSL